MGLLKDVWVDKNNGEVIDAKTDNLIAHTVIDLQDEVANVKTTADEAFHNADSATVLANSAQQTADNATELAYTAQENIDIKVWPELETNKLHIQELADRAAALEENMGDVETALDGIIAIQNSLMGVSE